LKVKADTQPPDTLVVQVDYLVIAADGSQAAQGRESVTVLVAVDDRGAVEACVSAKKRPQDACAIKVMTKFLDGLGTKRVILQTDGKNTIQSVARQMAEGAITTVTFRTTPRYSHQSNGRVEGMSKTLAGIMRSIKSELEKTRTSQLDWNRCLLPMLLKYCARTLTRFKTFQDGHTALFRLTRAEYRGDVVLLAEVVMAKMPVGTKLSPSELAPRWVRAVWLGRSSISDKHMVSCDTGMWSTRTVRR
jgi:hypothetical protein